VKKLYLRHRDLSKYIILDIEADGLTPSNIWCAVGRNAATLQKWELRGHGEIKRFINEAPLETIWVGHNFLSYDAPNLNRLLGTRIPVRRIVDTLVLSYLYNPRLENGHSLEAWATRLHLPIEKDHFNDFSQFSENLLDRCSKDVDINLELFYRLTRKMVEIGYSEESCEIEHEIRHIVNGQQRNGFFFDIQRAEELFRQFRQREADLAEPIHRLFPPTLQPVKTYKYKEKADGSPYQSYLRHVQAYPQITREPGLGVYYTVSDWKTFNIGSPTQRLQKLLELGYKPTKKTKKGKPSIDEDSLVEAAKELGKPELQAIADWLVENARGNMCETYLEHVNREDHCIHGTLFSCGAASRRMTHRAPNTSNIPSNEAKYGKEMRGLFTARPGRLLVGYDAKALQMRLFGHYLKNPTVAKLYIEGDPHQINADAASILRKPAKNCFYAMIFGARDKKLGTTGLQGGTEADGARIRAALYKTTPGLEEAVEGSKEEWRNNHGRLRCLDGGYVICPKIDAAFNYWIQPAEVCVMKKAAIYVSKRAKCVGIDHLKVADNHDEGQHDVNPKDAKTFGELAIGAIRDAGEHFNLTVPMAGDYKIGKTWAETH